MTKGMDGGRLVMKMTWRDGRVAAVAVETRRPAAAPLLRGRTPQEAQALVPRVFSLCGKAQAAACRAACEVAGGDRVEEGGRDGSGDAGVGGPGGMLRRLDDARIVLEAGQEHLWRLLLDWPRLLGETPREAEFVYWHKRLAQVARRLDAARAGERMPAAGALPAELAALPALAADLQEFLDASVFAPEQPSAPAPARKLPPADVLPADSWAGRLLAAVADDAPGAPIGVRLLPAVPAAAWRARLAQAGSDFAARPLFDGAPAETGPLARHAGHPLVAAKLAAGRGIAARLAARLLDLAALPGQLARVPARIDAAGGAGDGIACVETARGLLIHAVRLAGGRIADYTVVAPTEWNFHPDGLWRAELLGRPVADAAAGERLLRRLALALDPCVPVTAEVTEAAEAAVASAMIGGADRPAAPPA